MRRAVLIIGCAVWAADALSATVDTVETSGAAGARAAFLSRGIGARAVGMGEAFTAVADDATAAAWNPGGLGQVKGLAAVATFDAVGLGVGVGDLAVAVPAGPMVLGFNLVALSFGGYDVRDAAGVLTGTASVTDVAGGASVAFANPRWLGGAGWSGVGVELVHESVGATSVAAMVGSVVPMGRTVAVGWAARHLGAATGGAGLPAVVSAGGAWSPANAFRLAVDAGYALTTRLPLGAVGVEVRPVPAFAVRAGFRYRSGSVSPAGLVGATAGAGVRFGAMGLDYAYQPFGDLAVSHRVTIGYAAPSAAHRDPGAVARGGGQETRGEDEDAYAKSARLYSAGRYDDALAGLRNMVKDNPGHWQAWQLAGNCLVAKGNESKALELYRQSLKIHPDNPQLRSWVREHADTSK